jgi:hypothetical protein
MNKLDKPHCAKLAGAIISLCLIAIGNPVFAADGVHEINQACVATGCFQDDGPGFPVTIQNPGSYILTSEIDVTGESVPQNVTAVSVHTDAGVVIDLNGFRIVGPTACTGGTPPKSCSPTGTGIGIDTGMNGVTVRNGKIFGMGDDGVHLISGSRIENLDVESCGGDGIFAGGDSLILNNLSRRNGGLGIWVGPGSLVLGNIIFGNIGFGLNASLAGYNQNSISANDAGNVLAGVQLGENLCGGALCP